MGAKPDVALTTLSATARMFGIGSGLVDLAVISRGSQSFVLAGTAEPGEALRGIIVKQ